MKFPRRKRQREKNLKNRKKRKGTDPAADTATKEDAGLSDYGTGFLGGYVPDFAPSDKDEAKVESVGGFNADIPQPKGDGIISDKKTAYEQEQMVNKQADKMRSLQDFAFSLGEENGNGEDLTLIDDAPAEKPKNAVIDFGAGAPNNSRSSIQSSAAAYRDMNRQLGSFYETPKEDKEKRNSNGRWKNSLPGSMRKKAVRAAWMNRWHLWKSPTNWRQSI